MHQPSFKELIRNLFEITKKVDKAVVELKIVATEINAKYEPREQFIRWRDSKEGQVWKQQQYHTQLGCCAICKEPIHLKGSHIDHKKPIFHRPDLALDTRNLQITCLICNPSKSNKISDCAK